MGNVFQACAVPALSLRQLVAGHIHFLKQSLNPIFETKELENSTKRDEKFTTTPSFSSFDVYCSARLHAGFAILLQLYTVLYGVFGFISFESITSVKAVLKSDRLYTHQILPRVAWPQLDAGLGMDIVVSLIIFTILSFKRENAPKNTVFYPTASLQKEILINRRSSILMSF